MSAANRTELSGLLAECGKLRYTPAGIPAIEFRIVHGSEQMEAGHARRVECDLACVALGNLALLFKDAPLGVMVWVRGFLAARSLKRKTPVLHVTSVEFGERFSGN